ncbi:YbjQ family protein [Halanaerobaculum tunisiense]
MIITTTEQITGNKIKENLGLVRGNTIRTRHLGNDILAVLRNLIGGEVKGYTAMISDTREEALKRMKQEAKNLGAEAVINVRFSTSQVMTGASEILAYGTAVKLESKTKS